MPSSAGDDNSALAGAESHGGEQKGGANGGANGDANGGANDANDANGGAVADGTHASALLGLRLEARADADKQRAAWAEWAAMSTACVRMVDTSGASDGELRGVTWSIGCDRATAMWTRAAVAIEQARACASTSLDDAVIYLDDARELCQAALDVVSDEVSVCVCACVSCARARSRRP